MVTERGKSNLNAMCFMNKFESNAYQTPITKKCSRFISLRKLVDTKIFLISIFLGLISRMISIFVQMCQSGSCF